MRTLLPLALLVACAPPDVYENNMHKLEVSVANGGVETNLAFIEAAQSAQDYLAVALPTVQDTDLANALVEAQDRGVLVEVVTDFDEQNEPGVQILQDAGVPVQLADAGIAYFDFGTNSDVAWTSEQTIMAHAFIQWDLVHIVSANRAGDVEQGQRVLVKARGEDLGQDLWMEHNQVFGGADSTASTAFNALQKSITDYNVYYASNTATVSEMWYGPQQRVVKRFIDAIYGARGDIRVLTNDLGADGIVTALQDKASWGFDVEIIVGPNFGDTIPTTARQLRNDAPDVRKFQYNGALPIPTVVLIDYGRGLDGNWSRSRAYVAQHDLYATQRVYRGSAVVSDSFIDSTLWVFDSWNGPTDDLKSVETVYNTFKDLAGPL